MERKETQAIPRFAAIVVAAGKGERLDHKTPKQFLKLGGRPLWRWSVDTLLDISKLQVLYLVINPSLKQDYERDMPDDPRINLVSGGQTRFESVKNAVGKLDVNSPLVTLIHDSARPFAKKVEIEKSLRLLSSYSGLTFSTKVLDTLRIDDNKLAGETINRDKLRAIQTPQIFKTILLKDAIDDYKGTANPTDETQVFSSAGHDVVFFDSDRQNFKITTQEDLDLARSIISTTADIRVGQGFDAHRFDKDSVKGGVRLCGVHVPKSAPLKGHSDADVGLHALVDAILGALGQGDIGDHFPPSDPQWKDVASSVFVEKAVNLLRKESATLQNIDLTLICEHPKIGPYKDKMKERIAKLCRIDDSLVNIKATTTENMGFTGREEGIAAMASVTIKKEGV